MNLRRNLLMNAWLQLGLVLAVVLLANLVASSHFARVDLTRDHIYTLSDASRKIVSQLDKPLLVKVYFTRELEAPYNNHEQILLDKLDEFRAYSKGHMEISSVDPTGQNELEEEAQRFGIRPIQYRYQGKDRSELKRVFMGASFVYGDKQGALEAVTQIETIEYEIARLLGQIVLAGEKKTLGFTSGSQEVDVMKGAGPLESLRTRLGESYELVAVPLGGEESVPAEVDALFVIGPQGQVGERARYQLDQYLMRGGSLAVFLTHLKPDMRSYRAEELFSGLEPFLGHLGVVVNRDIIMDRNQNGVMRFPVRQGRHSVQIPINYPLIPRSTDLSAESLVVKGLDQMLFPFVSSLKLAKPLPTGVESQILASSSAQSVRLKTLRSIDPMAFKNPAPGEEVGAFPLMVSLTGTFVSYFSGRPIPPLAAETPFGLAATAPDDPASRINDGAPARLVVAGSADVAANNLTFMLNLADWMCQDEQLIGIRSKSVQIPPMELPTGARLLWLKLANALGGTLLLLVIGGIRWTLRRRGTGTKEIA